MIIETWQFVLIVAGSTGVGLLSGVALAYPIGRRHGIAVMAAEWRKANRGQRPNKAGL